MSLRDGAVTVTPAYAFLPASRHDAMALSARNRNAGTITSIAVEGPIVEVVLDVGGENGIDATITSGSVDRLDLSEGDETTAVVKASDVMLSN